MTPSKTVTVKRETLSIIFESMGLQDEDAKSFWRLARREERDPGCILREREEYLQKLTAGL